MVKIAIASNNKDENAKISEIAGRASYFHIYDDKNFIKIIENPFKENRGGAGSSVADMLKNEKVELLISGKIGEKMKNSFEQNNIEHKESDSIPIKKVLEML